MSGGTVAGRWSLHVGAVLFIALLGLGSGHAAVAGNDHGTIGTGDDMEPATPVDGSEPGGPLVSLPDETTPVDDPSGDDVDVVTPESTPDVENEAIAPGTVTVVLWTSDQRPLPNRATVCIDGVCQSVANMMSGGSMWFDEVPTGWQEVTVEVGPPYGSTSATIDVRTGVNGVVELTLVPVQPAPDDVGEPAPATDLPVQFDPQSPSPEQASSGVTRGSGSRIIALPATGANAASAPSLDLALALSGMALGLLLATCVATRWARNDR